MINCEYVVETLEEFKELELYLFGLDYQLDFNTTIYCHENMKTYFYKLQNVDGKLLLVTDGEK